MKSPLPLFFVVLLAILVCCVAVDRSKFRTCHDTGFCRRHRNVQSTDNLVCIDFYFMFEFLNLLQFNISIISFQVP